MSTYVIAEAGVNHNGSMELARDLIEVAAEAGADAIKFQTFRSEELVAEGAPKADYQTETTDAEESQAEMLRRLELSPEQHHTIAEHCADQDLQFLSTPFDAQSARFLVDEFDVPRVKIGSGELTNGPLLRYWRMDTFRMEIDRPRRSLIGHSRPRTDRTPLTRM